MISFGTQRRLWVLPATFVVAFVMFALPVGEEWKSYMPAWVTLVLIYWCLATPEKITLGTGWLIGLGLDILAFGLLGRYALTKTLITYLTRRVALRVRVYPVWQQSVFVLMLLALESVILVAIGYLIEGNIQGLAQWRALAIGAALWPFIFWFLRHCRRWSRLP
ncbi:MAG: rod shape-determining protein MreD [Proteobacteria bacterium]|nr:rod shape-determining protein MreD [Pseudomonadota bacterium]MBP10883.1 rod shape-determining protein MreD [Acidiferrobacteraceae bacterium]MDP6138138.1 rod shape-determining protein MreD [Arenicellales bacterium]MDP7219743.1 rod shape-determining protein MreD [Arenicellales bacterium]HJP10545.1 rod shape-determining protein MreD [Arenicellales bacterium]